MNLRDGGEGLELPASDSGGGGRGTGAPRRRREEKRPDRAASPAAGIHPRNKRFQDRILSAPYEICIERARYYTESFRRTEGEHPALRAAKAFAHTLASMTVTVLDEERFVGNRTGKFLAAGIPVERGEFNLLFELELDYLTNRKVRPFRIEPREKEELFGEIFPYWRGKTLRDRKKALWKANGLHFKPALGPLSLYRRLKGMDFRNVKKQAGGPKPRLLSAIKGLREFAFNNPAFLMNVFDVQGHLIIGQGNVLGEGFAGLKARALEGRKKAERDGDREGVAFLKAVEICCDAIRDFAARMADKAEKVAARTEDEARKRELLEIAGRCRHVPFHPPRDFREAVQALWLTQVGGLVACGMTGILAVGRIDQYLYPFYEKDRAEGRIGDDEVRALLEELLLKLASNLMPLPKLGKLTGSELGSDSCSPTIGGVGRDGRDAVNALSYLVLEAFANVKGTGNSFMIRMSEKSPDEWWRRVVETHRTTSGAALFYDETITRALEGSGMEKEDARDYGLIGCVEPTGEGNTFGCTSGNDISLGGALEMALLDGHLRIMGKRVGPKTGDPRRFATFEQFREAFERQVRFMVETVAKGVNLKDEAYREGFPCPYVSATLTGCIESARDMTAGGAKYNFGSIGARGLGTAVNALAAIRHFVYEEKRIPMGELLRMLDGNFKGAETTRSLLANKGPKYGCDDDAVDAIAQAVVEFFCKSVTAQKSIRGGPFRPSFFSYGMHVIDGWVLGATPDGRRAGEPLSNSFSPANGSERKGPTAMLRSVSKNDATLISNGCAVNLKLPPSLFEGAERVDKMVSLLKGYFQLGGMEIQLNVVSNETLRDAQLHPENYRDLVVRVSGFSAHFTDLGRAIQDEIIRRSEFDRL